MFTEMLVLVALPLLLAVAAGWDIASFTIPNFLNVALIAVFAVFALTAGLSFSAIGWHLLAGIAALAVSAFASELTTPIMVTPSAFAHWQRMSPTPPAAA